MRDRRTVLLEARGTYPLQIARPYFDPVKSSLSLSLLQLSAGLLDGDSVSIEVVVEPGARLALQTQAATQLHAGRSAQSVQATIGEGGWFSYVPHALVPHALAEHHGRTHMDLAQGAYGLVTETLSAGRIRFGEAFAYRQVRLDLDVRRAGALVARERAIIRPGTDAPWARFGRFTHVGTAYLFGVSAPPSVCDTQGMQVGCTELAAGGWLVRVLGCQAAAIERLLQNIAVEWWAACAD